ncbi:E3 ubiquitin-protein ligase RNF25 isoform X2 [Dunckerocampus dactyliophorus]|uniref:E3 ubiquitin-protein ligase RNF25 isoform X2 n=1 Tax=Dunckerocampus dactyliophorus TaxID=161453 RepID=UPI002406FAAC|nr:E3 ubiquitin-protein ligase RNF25 isoform X2 [Dunckerocampus dactyliophorus]
MSGYRRRTSGVLWKTIMAMESDVQCEIEVLQSIYLEDLQVTRTQDRRWEVSLVLYPSTAEDSGSQFVRLTLTLTLDEQYPCSSPHISIHNPRGLSDDKLSSVHKCLQMEAESCVGSPVLYQLIEKAKEILTDSNIPHGNCVICLYGFKEGETFTKTRCYHYFHSHCLGRYASHSEKELRLLEKEMAEDKTAARHQELTVVCPVCREPLAYDLDQLLASTAPHLPELDGAAIESSFQQKWRELQKVLERQRRRGGVIDPEVESNRFLIHINEAPLSPIDVEAVQHPPLPSTSQQCPPPSQHCTPAPTHCRGAQAHKRHSHGRGQRRGGGPRPHHGRGAPITEHLDRLRLSSYASEGPLRANAEERTDVKDTCEAVRSEPNANHFTLLQAGSDSLKCAAGGRAQRGRRRGPHPQHSTRGDPPQHHHWDPRAPRGGAPHQQRVGGREERL